MQVKKRNGAFELVDLNKIVRAVGRCCSGLQNVDANRVAIKRYPDFTTARPRRSSTSCRSKRRRRSPPEEPEYSRLAARLLSTFIDKEVSASRHPVVLAVDQGGAQSGADQRPPPTVRKGQQAQAERRGRGESRNQLFEYFGLRTVYDRYLLQASRTNERSLRPRSISSCGSRARCVTKTCKRGARTVRPAVVARVSAEFADPVQLGHSPRAAVVVLFARFALKTT